MRKSIDLSKLTDGQEFYWSRQGAFGGRFLKKVENYFLIHDYEEMRDRLILYDDRVYIENE